MAVTTRIRRMVLQVVLSPNADLFPDSFQVLFLYKTGEALNCSRATCRFDAEAAPHHTRGGEERQATTSVRSK